MQFKLKRRSCNSESERNKQLKMQYVDKMKSNKKNVLSKLKGIDRNRQNYLNRLDRKRNVVDYYSWSYKKKTMRSMLLAPTTKGRFMNVRKRAKLR
jgi:hypothetical protein